MAPLVKICGLRSAADAAGVSALGPDAVGFVFWPRSRRAVIPVDVAAWTRSWPPGIRKVGVFVDEPAETILRIADQAGLDIIQLHGAPDAARARRLDRPLWQVVRLDGPPLAAEMASLVDALLIDSYSAQTPGGTGRAVDWDAAGEFIRECRTPVILAGGLTPANVIEAMRRAGPRGVDVSSGVENQAGGKDLAKVKAFIERCRSC